MENPYQTTSGGGPLMSPAPPPNPGPGSSGWPNSLGLVVAIFGGCALAMGLFSFALLNSGITEKTMLEAAKGLPEAEQFHAYLKEHALVTNIIMPGAAVLLGALALWSGLALRARKPNALGLTLTWAGLKSLYALLIAPVSLGQAKAQLPMTLAMQKQILGKTPGALDMTSMMEVMVPLTVALQTVWMLLLPLFCLIWFFRKKIRLEMSGWGRESTPQ
jgi:hypothetical protein